MAVDDKDGAKVKPPAKASKVKKEPINRAKLGPEYIAPDGGHGWFVAVAAGCSNVSRNQLFISHNYSYICRVNLNWD